VTDQRVILRHPHALGLKKNYTDYDYQDISNVFLSKGVLRSNLRFTLRMGGDSLALDSLPNDKAQRAYGIVRENLVRYQTPTASTLASFSMMNKGSAGSSWGYCKNCGAPLGPESRFCGKCGAEVGTASVVVEKQVVKVKCTYCGVLNDPTASVCESCGARL